MRTCQNCGRENPLDRDFCECGEYLRWEPTNYQISAVTPPAPPAEEPPAEQAPPAEAAPPAPVAAPADDDYVSRVQPAAPRRAAAQQPAPPPPPPPQPPRAAAPPPPPPPPPPLPPPEPAAPAPPPVEAAAAITLRLAHEQPGAGAGPLGVSVVPGERARVLALVRNQSSIVDNYELVVHGLPREWWTVNPQTVYLVPFGSAGSYEQEVEILLHPPRTPEAEARRWELEVGVYSRASETEVAVAPMTLGILPFEDYAIRLRPERASGRLKAKYTVRVSNKANAVVLLAIDAADSDGECKFKFDSQAIEVPTGSSKNVGLKVKPPRQIYLGRPLERRFEVVAASGEAGEQLLASKAEDAEDGGGKPGKMPKIPGVKAPKITAPKVNVGASGVKVRGPQMRAPQARIPSKQFDLKRPTLGLRALKPSSGQAAPVAPSAPLLPTQAIFRQKAWLPWWLAIVLPLLALLGLMLFLLLPKSATVPDVVGSNGVFAAQEKLTQAGFALGTREERPSADVPPGTVLAQSPAAGADAEKGSVVNIEIAIGSGDAAVPKLIGLTLVEAEKKLRDAELTKGAITPPTSDLKAKITGQVPEAGDTVKIGSAVDIFYGTAKPAGGAGGAGGAAGGAGGGGGPAVTAGDIAVPKIDPADVAGYSDVLTKAKLVPGTARRQLSDAKAGTVFATLPAVGTKVAEGQKVDLLVSNGFPLMAFDTGGNVVLAHSGTGNLVTPAVAKQPSVEKDPTWSGDGTRIVYTDDGQLMMSDPDKRDRAAVELSSEKAVYSDPSFAPTTKSLVLAAARKSGDDDSDLCVGKVGLDSYAAQCIADDSFAVGFAHWSTDGKTILVPAVSDKGNGIVRYHSDVPFSTQKSNWGKGVFVTPRSKETFVRDMAISPDGKQLAAVANIDSSTFLLYLTTRGDLKLEKAKKIEVPACKVDWMDDRWLAVVKLGALCDQDTGEIVRLTTDDPKGATTITSKGDNPTFKPFAGG